MADMVRTKVAEVAEALRAECRKQFGSDWNYDVSWAFARAAIEAMLMPTPQMIDAGMDKAEAQGSTLAAISPVWCAMIDAALTPSPPSQPPSP